MRTITTRARRRTAVIAGLLASLAVAACGGGDADEQTPTGRAATVDMADLRFQPRQLTVQRATTVTFKNVGKVTHNAKGKTFFSRVVEPGGSYRHRFDDAGTFDYVCTFHPGMEGTVTVR